MLRTLNLIREFAAMALPMVIAMVVGMEGVTALLP
jgi:hypothetical protein